MRAAGERQPAAPAGGGPGAVAARAGRAARAREVAGALAAAWIVYAKELVDALRDRRTLLTVLLSSVAVGPLVLVLVSTLVGGIERRAEARSVVVHGLAHAPTLANYLARQTYTVREAPPDYEEQLRKSRLGEPVLVVPQDFEAALRAGEAPLLEVVSAASNQRASSGAGTLVRLLRGFNQEQATLRLAVRGVAPALLEAVRVEERDLSTAATRAAQLATMVPFFVLMAVLYGALNAALDTTAGERERGSLEPLLMAPVPRVALVLGKWGAVASVAMLIAVLSCASFLPGQWLLRSEVLAAMFRFGVREAAWFVALLLPLAGALSALLMALAIRCKSFKEAQANTTVVLLVVSLLPLVTVFNQEGEQPWHLWLPALAQATLMGRVLKGEALPWMDLAVPVFVALGVTVLSLFYVARLLRRAALK
ncbi:MAG: ABC transporter permease [Rubrivivax sp.]|nr:ABC transporter permease [Rubrivivax sp.]